MLVIKLLITPHDHDKVSMKLLYSFMTNDLAQ